MSTPAQYLEFEGALTRNAEMRQLICDKQGHLRPCVCLHLLTTVGHRPLHVKKYFADALAAEAYAKTLRKGAIVTVHLPLCELHLSGTADFVELQTPAPEAKPVQVQEPELQF